MPRDPFLLPGSVPLRRPGVASRLFSRPVAVLALLFLLGTFLGCMSLNVGRFSSYPDSTTTSADGVITQSGTVTVTENHPQTVYYAIPYVSTPNLTLKEEHAVGHGDWELVEQQWDHFTVRRRHGCSGSPFGVTWTAKGLKGPPPPAPVVIAPLSKSQVVSQDPVPPVGPFLPPTPVPVGPAPK